MLEISDNSSIALLKIILDPNWFDKFLRQVSLDRLFDSIPLSKNDNICEIDDFSRPAPLV